MKPTTCINPLASFSPQAVSCIAASASHISLSCLFPVYNGEPGDFWTVDGTGVRYAAYAATVPAGKIRSVTYNSLDRMFGPQFNPAAYGPNQSVQSVYERCKAEFHIIHAAGCDLVITDNEFEPADPAAYAAAYDAAVGRAMREEFPTEAFSDYLYAPDSVPQALTWPVRQIAQMSPYATANVFGSSYPVWNAIRTCFEGIRWTHQYHFGIAPNVFAAGYIQTMQAASLNATQIGVVWKMSMLLSMGFLLYFDQNDTNNLSRDLLNGLFTEFITLLDGSSVKRITNFVTTATEIYGVAELTNGSFICCYASRDARTNWKVVETGVGGQIYIAPGAGVTATYTKVTAASTKLPRYIEIADKASLVAHFPLNDSAEMVWNRKEDIYVGNYRMGSDDGQVPLIRGQPSLIQNHPNENSVRILQQGYPAVRLNDSATLRPSIFTVVAWIKADVLSTQVEPSNYGQWWTYQIGAVLATFENYNRGIWIGRANTSDKIICLIHSDGNFQGPAIATIPLGQACQVAMTYDGTTIRSYVDGSPGGTFSYSGAITAGTGDSYIGGLRTDHNEFYGQIQDVRIYNTVLTAEEIGKLAAIGHSKYVPPTSAITLGVDRGDGVPGKKSREVVSLF